MAYFINWSLIFTFHESIVGPSIHPKYGKTPTQRWCKFSKPLFVSLRYQNLLKKQIFQGFGWQVQWHHGGRDLGAGWRGVWTGRHLKEGQMAGGGPGRVHLSENMTLEIPEKDTYIEPKWCRLLDVGCWNFGLVFVVFFPFKNRGRSLGFQVCNHQSLAVEIL